MSNLVFSTTSGKTESCDDLNARVPITDQYTYKLLGKVLDYLTAPKLLLGWLTPSDGGTEVDYSSVIHNATYVTSKGWTTGSKLVKGNAWSLNFDGVNNYLTLADHNDFSFGNSSTDSNFSIGCWVEVVNGTGNQRIISKFDQTTGTELREWSLHLLSTEVLTFSTYDESENQASSRSIDSALSVGWHFIVVTYSSSAGSGATFADGITIYVDGVVAASTATNNASYVAMENLNTLPSIGGNITTTGAYGNFLAGDLGFLFITKETLTAFNIWKMYVSTRGYYNL